MCTTSAGRHGSSRTPQRLCGTPAVMTPQRLWRCPCLHNLGFYVHLGWRTWACCLRWSLTGSPHEAAAQEIEVCPAKHLAFHHLEAIDVPFDWAGAPGQGDACFDRCIVLAEPARKALQ